jgi:transposase-like protein
MLAWILVQTNSFTLTFFRPKPVISELFPVELREKHLVDDVLFLVDSASWLQATLYRDGLDYRYENHGDRNSAEHIIHDLKRRTNYFSNCFDYAEADTVEN